MAPTRTPRLSVVALCLVTTLTSLVSPTLVGVSSAPAAPAGPELPRAGPAPVRFAWPLAPPHPVVRPFDAPATPYGPGHRGVDLGAPAGAPVLSAGPGVVVFAGQLANRGVVSVDHPNGLRTTYEPLAPAVRAGGKVTEGTVLGRLRPGHAGCPGACLHWGVRRGDEYLDPVAFVATGHVRLKPWKDVG
jgi:murein DD-endopeptidase MepM/ murein hydrolase activator NlpD